MAKNDPEFRISECDLDRIAAEAKRRRKRQTASLKRGGATIATARFVRDPRGVDVRLRNGMRLFIPLSVIDIAAVTRANDVTLSNIESLDDACGIMNWPELDEGFSLSGLLIDLFEESLRVEFNRDAGKSKSPKKAAAARRNGKKGGRPRKTAAHGKTR